MKFEILAETSERIRATAKKKEKIALIAQILRQVGGREIYLAAHYLSGNLPSGRLGIGWRLRRIRRLRRRAQLTEEGLLDLYGDGYRQRDGDDDPPDERVERPGVEQGLEQGDVGEQELEGGHGRHAHPDPGIGEEAHLERGVDQRAAIEQVELRETLRSYGGKPVQEFLDFVKGWEKIVE